MKKESAQDSASAGGENLWTRPITRRRFTKQTGGATVATLFAIQAIQTDVFATESCSGNVVVGKTKTLSIDGYGSSAEDAETAALANVGIHFPTTISSSYYANAAPNGAEEGEPYHEDGCVAEEISPREYGYLGQWTVHAILQSPGVWKATATRRILMRTHEPLS